MKAWEMHHQGHFAIVCVTQFSNSVQVFFKGGCQTDCVKVKYPIGHYCRRQEAIPLLQAKFERNIATRLSPKNAAKLIKLCAEPTYPCQ